MLWTMFSTLSEATTSNLIPPFTRERIEKWTSNINYKETLAIVAIPKDVPRIIGTTSLNFNTQEVFRHKAELGLTIHDDHQNLGIGTAMLNHILAIAKKQGLQKIQLTVNAENKRAIHIYRKAGFEIEGTLHREMYFRGRYLDEHRMALFL